MFTVRMPLPVRGIFKSAEIVKNALKGARQYLLGINDTSKFGATS